jgi:hypothetical protein
MRHLYAGKPHNISVSTVFYLLWIQHVLYCAAFTRLNAAPQPRIAGFNRAGLSLRFLVKPAYKLSSLMLCNMYV